MFRGAIHKILVSRFLWTAVSRVILFLHRSIASSSNKEYLIAVFKHWLQSCKEFLSEHFAENRMTLWCTVAKLWRHKLCAAWLCDVRLQNYGAINFVPFFGPPCIYCSIQLTPPYIIDSVLGGWENIWGFNLRVPSRQVKHWLNVS